MGLATINDYSLRYNQIWRIQVFFWCRALFFFFRRFPRCFSELTSTKLLFFVFFPLYHLLATGPRNVEEDEAKSSNLSLSFPLADCFQGRRNKWSSSLAFMGADSKIRYSIAQLHKAWIRIAFQQSPSGLLLRILFKNSLCVHLTMIRYARFVWPDGSKYEALGECV